MEKIILKNLEGEETKDCSCVYFFGWESYFKIFQQQERNGRNLWNSSFLTFLSQIEAKFCWQSSCEFCISNILMKWIPQVICAIIYEYTMMKTELETQLCSICNQIVREEPLQREMIPLPFPPPDFLWKHGRSLHIDSVMRHFPFLVKEWGMISNVFKKKDFLDSLGFLEWPNQTEKIQNEVALLPLVVHISSQICESHH